MKLRRNLYLSRDVTDQVDQLARGKGGNKSRIVDDLVREAIAARGAKEIDALLKPRLDFISRDLRRLARTAEAIDLSCAATFEGLMLLAQHIFDTIPPLAENDLAGRAAGKRRFERFADELTRLLEDRGSQPATERSDKS